jgi:outer membrane receptor protein involved in Fe transport
MHKFSRRCLFIATMLLCAAAAAHAQVSRTTGALTGLVTDAQGSALPGVTVTITSPQLQGTRDAITDAQGQYTFPLLPPGTYNASYALSGLRTITRENIAVSLNQTTKINVPMQLEASETVTVSGNQVVVDPTQTQTQQNFKQEHLEYGVVGAANRSYQNVLFQAAGTASGAGGGSNPMVSGANVAQNDYLLDGINTTDPVTHTFGNNLPFNAIQEISIQTLGKEAEYGSSGGTVNVLTKSGGNTLKGAAEWHYGDTHLQQQGNATHPTGIAYFGATPTGSSLNFDKSTRPTMSSLPELELDGPLLRDRLWFMASLERPRTAVTNPNLFGFQPGTREFAGWDDVAKLTFTPAQNQTLTAKFIDSHARIPFANDSSFYAPEADALQRQGNRTYGVTYDAVLTQKWLADLQVGHTPASLSVLPMSGLNIPGVVDLSTGIATVNYTGAQARNSTRDEALLSSTYYLERFGGTHALKAGIDFNRTNFSSVNNAFGDPSQIPGYDPSFCSPAFGFPAGAACAGFIELNPSANVGQRINLSVINPLHTVDSKDYAYFAQDEWQPVTRLTVRYGVRYEQVDWNSRDTVSPPAFKMWQPRIGVAYDVFNNARSVVHGFGGRIMDNNQLTLPSYGVQQPLGSVYFNLNPATNRYVFGGSTLFTTGELYAPDLKPSYSNQYSLGFRQLIWRNTTIDVTGEYRKQSNLFEDLLRHSGQPAAELRDHESARLRRRRARRLARAVPRHRGAAGEPRLQLARGHRLVDARAIRGIVWIVVQRDPECVGALRLLSGALHEYLRLPQRRRAQSRESERLRPSAAAVYGRCEFLLGRWHTVERDAGRIAVRHRLHRAARIAPPARLFADGSVAGEGFHRPRYAPRSDRGRLQRLQLRDAACHQRQRRRTRHHRSRHRPSAGHHRSELQQHGSSVPAGRPEPHQPDLRPGHGMAAPTSLRSRAPGNILIVDEGRPPRRPSFSTRLSPAGIAAQPRSLTATRNTGA